jgi:hypothetical protein
MKVARRAGHKREDKTKTMSQKKKPERRYVREETVERPGIQQLHEGPRPKTETRRQK